MIGLYISLVIVIGVVCTVGLFCYFQYKSKEFECQKVCGKQNEEISIKALELEIEKENTKQMELNSNAFIEKQRVIKAKEETKHLKIKTEYREKYNDKLF